MLLLVRMAEIQAPSNPISLPLRRRAQLKRVLAGEPIGKASLAVGYASKATGSRALSDTRKRIVDAMDHFSLTPEVMVRDYLIPLMNATETKLFAHEGVILDERELADNGTRKDTLRMAFQLRGAFPKEEGSGPSHLSITLNNIAVTE